MARFIRSKVKRGDYTNASEVLRDAVRRMQAEETAKESERDDIRRSLQRGIKALESGQFEEYDADGLRGLGKELVARSARKQAARTKAV